MDIIALFFLARYIGQKAIRKGLPKGRWILYTVLAWIGLELMGAVAGLMISGDIIRAGLLGLAAGFGGFLLVNHRLNQMPDKLDESWIDRLGKQDSE